MHPRKLARQVARAQLEKAGATGYNKKRVDHNLNAIIPSYFQRHWRDIARGMTEKGAKT